MGLRYFTCLLCNGFKITLTNGADRKREYKDVCLKCHYIISEFDRLKTKGVVIKVG